MTTEKTIIRDLTTAQQDYATFLPALSSFYAAYIGKQRYGNHVDLSRIPSNFPNNVESLNYLDPKQGMFHYKWTLYSAGHANLDVNKHDEKEDMIRNRDRSNTWALGDSGGFQIGKGVWEGDWKDPNCPKASKKRKQVLEWMDAYMDYGMVLDLPAWIPQSPKGRKASGINTYQDAVNGTRINNDYFMNNRSGECKFLNVLQGETHTEAEDWYNQMKDYCDPKKYPGRHFNGWAMGGQNKCDLHLVLRRLIALRFDGLLEPGLHDNIHFLGTSKLEWALLLTDIQRAIRKYHNPNFMVTFDCASPFLATANGQIYTETRTPDRAKWTYKMLAGADDKKYALDNRLYRDAVLADGIFSKFEDSPISEQLKISDVCWYGPNDLNKIGKIGRTSWDSFSYAIQMGHNIWMHINAVQEANRQYDQNVRPNMLIASKMVGKRLTQYNHNYLRDIINDIFATSDRGTAERIVEEYNRYWMAVPGTSGTVGERALNTTTKFNELFEVSGSVETAASNTDSEDNAHSEDFTEQELENLEELENSDGTGV